MASGDVKKLVDFATANSPITLRTGDSLGFYLAPQAPVYIYVLFETALKELSILYPADVTKLDVTVNPPATGADWFELEAGTGLDTVHLIASAKPLQPLTALLRAHEAAGPPQRPAAAAGVLAEIVRIKRDQMMARAVERPTPVAGQTRAVGFPDIGTIAREISAGDSYSRTFTIDHR